MYYLFINHDNMPELITTSKKHLLKQLSGIIKWYENNVNEVRHLLITNDDKTIIEWDESEN